MSLATCKDSSQVPEKHNDLIVYLCRIYSKEKTNFSSNNWYCYSQTILHVCACVCVKYILYIIYYVFYIMLYITNYYIFYIYRQSNKTSCWYHQGPNFQCKKQITHIKSKNITKISIILNWKWKYQYEFMLIFFPIENVFPYFTCWCREKRI